MRKILCFMLAIIMILPTLGGLSVFATDTKDGTQPSGPLDYLHQGEYSIRTISSHIRLEDILDYNGVVRNMHIAKWVNSSNEDLEFPAYCIDPGIAGVAQHADKKYTVNANAALSEGDKKILGIMRSGFPYKTADQLNLDTEIDAYYATQCAIWHYIQNGDNESTLSVWRVHSGNAERNEKILAAMKSIYLTGKANPYTPPEITWMLEPVNGDGTTETIEGDWIVNEYEVISNYPFTEFRLMFWSDEIKQLAQNGKIKLTDSDGNQFYQQYYVAGTWDDVLSYKIPAGTRLKLWYDKTLADSQGTVEFDFYGTLNDVEMEYTVAYLGDSSLGDSWQGYAYNFVPFQSDGSIFRYTNQDRTTTLIVEKADAKTGQQVPGAVFRIKGTSNDTSHIDFTVTASKDAAIPQIDGETLIEVNDGFVKMTYIPPGLYEITEISPPPHYAPPEERTQTVEVTVNETAAASVSFKNEPYGSLKIRKIDSVTGQPMDGVTLQVANPLTGFSNQYITQNGGYVDVMDLAEAAYVVTEVATLPGYVLSDEAVTTTVRWGEETLVTFKNEPDGTVIITKVDAITGEHLRGANIMVTSLATGQTWDVITDADGTAELKLPPGDYSVQEKNAPKGYELNPCPQTVIVPPGETSYVKIQNNPFGSLLITKVNAKTNQPMAGVKLRICNDKLNYDKTEATDSKGQIHLTDLKPGDYTITEISTLPGFELSAEALTKTVVYGRETTAVFTNEPRGSTTVIKVDSVTGEYLPNANIMLISMETGQTWDMTTGADGSATVSDLQSGDYFWQEQNPPPHYELNDQVYPVKVVNGENSDVKIQNNPLGSLLITKVDAKTGAPMAGVQLRIRSDSLNYDRTELTNNKGEILLEDLYPADYIITEESTIPGYEISTEVLVRTVAYGKLTTAIFGNKPLGSTTAIKVDSITGEHLPGANLKLTNPTTGQTWDLITNENGNVTVDGLAEGEYYWQEQNPPPNYELNDRVFPITVVSGENSTAKIQNNPLGALEITKVSSLDATVTLEGVKLRVQNTVLGYDRTFTTGSDGKILITGLYPSDYTITEVGTISGFFLSPEAVTATVNYGYTTPVIFKNDPKPYIELLKTDINGNPLEGAIFRITHRNTEQHYLETTDADGKIVIEDVDVGWFDVVEETPPNLYLPDDTVYSVYADVGKPGNLTIQNRRIPSLTITKRDKDSLVPLSGALFSIEKLDGLDAGFIAGSPFTSDSEGRILIPRITPGVYQITEERPPYGFNPSNPKSQIITIRADEDFTAVFEDTRKPSLILTKTDSRTGVKIEGATFTVEKLDAPNKGFLTGSPFQTDENGQIIINHLDSGAYRIVETVPANGFGLPEVSSWAITIKDNEDYYLNVKNTRLPTLVINKINGLTYKGIPNTYFEVYYAMNGSFYGEVRSLGTYKTDQNGQIVIPNCQVGWYRYVEVRSAPGYSKPSNPVRDIFLALGDNAYTGVGADAWNEANGILAQAFVAPLNRALQTAPIPSEDNAVTLTPTEIPTESAVNSEPPPASLPAEIDEAEQKDECEPSSTLPGTEESTLTPTLPNIPVLTPTKPNGSQ